MRSRFLLVAAALVALPGCGGGDDNDQSGTAVFVNACELLDPTEAGSILGAPIIERQLYVSNEPSDSGSCDLRSTFFDRMGNGPAVQVNVSSKTERPRAISSRNPVIQAALEPVRDVGAHAAYVPPLPDDPSTALVMAVTPEGVSLLLNVSTSLGDPTLKDKAVKLARNAASKASELFPGDRSALPTPTKAPVDLCGLVTVAEQVGAFGWAPTSESSPNGSVSEYVGDPAGGMWECVRTRPGNAGLAIASFKVELTKEPLPEAQWPTGTAARVGRPGRLLKSAGGPAQVAVFVAAMGGRRLALSAWDENRTTAQLEQALLSVARMAVSRIPA